MSQESGDKTELLLNLGDQTVPYLLPESIVRGESYQVILEHVYDPSKFWLVLKFKELNIFMRYLKDFYNQTGNKKTVRRDKLKKKLLCIVRRNDMYYRSIIQPILLPNRNKVRVFMVDYGFIANVPVDDIFYIFKKHCEVPRFAIRACLANISPIDPSKMWSQTVLKSFCAQIEGRKLVAQICEIDAIRRILFVDIQTLSGSKYKSISHSLVNMKLAAYSSIYEDTETVNLTKYKSKVKYLYLFPTFEALENGAVPCSLWEHDLLKNVIPLDILYKNYYSYQGIYIDNAL